MAQSDTALIALAWLGTYLVHSTLFLLTAWIVLRGRSLRRPRLVERTWRFALFAGLLTATIQVRSGVRPILGSIDLAERIVARTPAAPETSTAAPVPGAEGSSPATSAPGRDPGSPSGAPASSSPSSRRRSTLHRPIGPELVLDRRTSAPRSAQTSPSEAPPPLASSLQGSPDQEPSVPVAAPPAEERSPAATVDASSAQVPLALPGPAPARGSAALGSTSALDARRAPGPLVGAALLWTWIGFGALGLFLFAVATMRLKWILHRRQRVDSGPLLERLRALERRAGHARPVRLSLSRLADSPLTLGWFRSEIVLPERALQSLSPAQVDSMLAHELAHALRRDPLWFSLYSLCERVLFFQPLNRLARSELHGIAELLCDDWAVRLTGQRLALASCLAEVAHWILGRPSRAAVPAMTDRPSRLAVRVERLLDDRRSPQPEGSARGFALATVLAAALCVLAVPGVSSATAASERSPALSPAPKVLPQTKKKEAREEAGAEHGTTGARPAETAAPVPAGAEPDPLPSDLTQDHALLEQEFVSLEQEVQDLSEELVSLGLSERFSTVIEDLRTKLAALRAQHDRLNAIVDGANGTPHTSRQPESTPKRKSP